MAGKLEYIKKQLDKNAAELVKIQYSLAQLTHENKQLKAGYQLLSGIPEKFTEDMALNQLFEYTLKSMLINLTLDRVLLLKFNEANNSFETYIDHGVVNNTHQLVLKASKDYHHSITYGQNSQNGLAAEIIARELEIPSFISTPVRSGHDVLYLLIACRMHENTNFRKAAFNNTDVFVYENIARLLSSLEVQFKQKDILEKLLVQRTNDLQQQQTALKMEKDKSENLLVNILPQETIDELKLFGKTKPLIIENASVLFCDFVNFTQISETMDPERLVFELDYCFKAFDDFTSRCGIEKIKTIGDSYMCVTGLYHDNKRGTIQLVNAALKMIHFLDSLDKQEFHLKTVRIGIHTGPVIAGVVGKNKFSFDIWGDVVNQASRFESNGVSGKVNISEKTYSLIKDKYDCKYRGKIPVKGKGSLDMYLVVGRKSTES